MTAPLTVYKASAGSGKTFTLATEYIKLLVNNPHQYRNILAVTFTNKATEEMKMRILSQLYGIWKQYPESASYTDKICRELGCGIDFLRKQAGLALHLLIHNYSYFRVETIDSFFQSVLRNLARELDLSANLIIELNDTEVEQLAVDKMIDDLTLDDEIMQWIMDYVYDNINDEKGWNVISQIKSFGQTIFKDFYKEKQALLKTSLESPDFFKTYITTLKNEIESAKENMRMTSESFFEALDASGFTIDDLSYGKSGVASLFFRIKEGPISINDIGPRVLSALDTPEKWFKKSHPRKEELRELVETELNQILKYAIEEMPSQWKRYQSASLALRHLYKVRLLNAIEKTVRQLNEESNRFLLSDTQHLLHSLVNDNDSPFIFEKIGTRLEHIMIDEFQDTSVVQWKNFKVLLQECMSHQASENLIVGDVKQSIYRWRSGDWRLLNNIESEFVNPKEMVRIESLSTNYRSKTNIIHFNNAFFQKAHELEYIGQKDYCNDDAEQLKRAYSDVCQLARNEQELTGKVVVKLLNKEDYRQRMLSETVETVMGLVNQGVSQSDIAILVRTNALIPLIAEFFAYNCPKINIVSDEAFKLSSSEAVRLIVESLHLLTHPDDILSRHKLILLYQTGVKKNEYDANAIFMGIDVKEQLPAEFEENRDKLLKKPLFELVDTLCKIFDIEKMEGQTAYLCAFLDELSKFTIDTTTDIDSFLKEWDNTLCNKKIRIDQADGVRILSIHKSKGLEFDNVVIPFCDWRLEFNGDILWCEPTSEPFNALPLVPVDYSSKALTGTIFENDYLSERLQNIVDNLNLLYVAFTRAGRNLFVFGKREAASTRSALIEQCLPLVTDLLPESTLEGLNDDSDDISFEYGTIDIPQKKKQTESPNVMLTLPDTLYVNYERHEARIEFKQSNKSREFVEGDDDSQSYIKLGSLLHNVLSRINTVDDIDLVVNEMEEEGLIDNTVMNKQDIISLLRKRLVNPLVKDWFTDKWTLYNECTLLRYDKSTHNLLERRPDRVMSDGNQMVIVDFKFGNPKTEYHDQVREYIHLLKEMGNTNVKGYLWYVFKNTIEEVEQ